MMDDMVPFPAAETAETERKPSRRRRGGGRRHKAYPAPAEEPPAAAAIPVPASLISAPSAPVSVPSVPPARAAVEQRLSLFIDFENIALGVRDAQYKKF